MEPMLIAVKNIPLVLKYAPEIVIRNFEIFDEYVTNEQFDRMIFPIFDRGNTTVVNFYKIKHRITDDQLKELVMSKRNGWYGANYSVLNQVMSDDLFDQKLRAEPELFVMGYEEFIDRVTDEHIEYFVNTCPGRVILEIKDIKHRVTDEQFDRCVRAEPGLVLSLYGVVAEFITQEQFDWCVRKSPDAALGGDVVKELSQEQFDWCVRKTLNTVLNVTHPNLIARLSSEQLDSCIRESPTNAMYSLDLIKDRLSTEQIYYLLKNSDYISFRQIPCEIITSELWDFLIDKFPYQIEDFAQHLTKDQLDRAVHEYPRHVLNSMIFGNFLTDEHLEYLVQTVPEIVMERWQLVYRVTDEQFDRLVKHDPSKMLCAYPRKLTDEQFEYCVEHYNFPTNFNLSGRNYSSHYRVPFIYEIGQEISEEDEVIEIPEYCLNLINLKLATVVNKSEVSVPQLADFAVNKTHLYHDLIDTELAASKPELSATQLANFMNTAANINPFDTRPKTAFERANQYQFNRLISRDHEFKGFLVVMVFESQGNPYRESLIQKLNSYLL